MLMMPISSHTPLNLQALSMQHQEWAAAVSRQALKVIGGVLSELGRLVHILGLGIPEEGRTYNLGPV